jgi:hypothetical protein
MVRWLFALVAILCAFSAKADIPDPGVYLTQYQCADGRFPTYCQGERTVPVEIGTPMGYRRADWGRPGGWMLTDAFHWPSSPFYGLHWVWPAEPQNNGGEVYEKMADRVRILFTKDASYPGNQYFNPCEVDGWVLFENTVPTGRWAEKLYRQRGAHSPTDCSGVINNGFTRSRLEDMFVPWLIDGVRVDLFQHVVISEQYNNDTIEHANRIERFMFGFGEGRVYWALCLTDNGKFEDFSYRLPRFPFSECPAGFRLADARLNTQIISATPPTPPAQYAWP